MFNSIKQDYHLSVMSLNHETLAAASQREVSPRCECVNSFGQCAEGGEAAACPHPRMLHPLG